MNVLALRRAPDSPAGYPPTIRDMPSDERPRERLQARGAETLSNPELLAILLRTGGTGENVVALATRLLAEFEGVAALGRVSFSELRALKGVGAAKAAQVLAAVELGRRVVSAEPERRASVRSSDDVYGLLRASMVDLEQEHLKVVLLNARNQVLGVRDVYKGSVHTAVVRVAEVFREPLRENCPAMIVVHNHPSGDPSPSPDDVAMTKQISEAGRLLDVDVLDHIVIARGGYVSLKERGLGFTDRVS
jgi:DNA repair protein RadC